MTKLSDTALVLLGKAAQRDDGLAIVPPNLTEEELAFYDTLETDDSAVKVLGDEAPRSIARERPRARACVRSDDFAPSSLR